MQVRSKLFFHLKRRKQADGTYGEFFIDPIVVANGPDPNGGNPNTYYDATGAGATGLLYEIGYVHQEPDTDDNDIVHERASGVDAIGDGEASRRATASCAKIFIELHKYN